MTTTCAQHAAAKKRNKRAADLVGATIGSWQVTGPVIYGRPTLIVCKCKCGSVREIHASSLRMGTTKSCGCGRGNGYCKFPEYGIWEGIRQRCNSKTNKAYKNYGGRGISVCAAWDDFGVFIADVGRRPSSKHTIDRYPDPNGNYEPGNVRWATWHEQSRNKRSNVFITYNGKTLCINDWSAITGISSKTLARRARDGWTGDRLMSKPLSPVGKAVHSNVL